MEDEKQMDLALWRYSGSSVPCCIGRPMRKACGRYSRSNGIKARYVHPDGKTICCRRKRFANGFIAYNASGLPALKT